MRRCHIASGILLFLPIINFAVAAPVLVQEDRQVGVDVVQLPENATTMLGKRGGELLEPIDNPGDHFANSEDFAANPQEWRGAPWRSRPPSRPAGGSTDVKQPPPSTPEEPSTVPGQGHVPPSSGSSTEPGDKLDAPPSGPSRLVKFTLSRLG